MARSGKLTARKHAAAVGLMAIGAVVALGCELWAGPGDPVLVDDDPRFAACGIPVAKAWMAFPMAEARDFSRHFAGWSEGAPELLVAEPALVVIGDGIPALRGGPSLVYDMCIAVGPPGDAIIHRYGPTRFDAIRPVLGGPIVAMP